MLIRLFSAAVGTALLLIVLFSNNMILLAASVSFITLYAIFEILRVCGLHRHNMLFCSALCFAVALIYNELSALNARPMLLSVYVVILFVFMLSGKGKISLEKVAVTFIIALVVPLFFLQIVNVRLMSGGKFLIYLIFIASFISDASAYFVGRSLGRHKLAPRISPKKTVEGAIGGLIGSVIGFFVFGACMQFIFRISVDYALLALYGALGGVAAIIGDLSASAIKREYDVKDYGDIMPGHGGVMDRFDSVLLVAPVMYYLLSFQSVLIF